MSARWKAFLNASPFAGRVALTTGTNAAIALIGLATSVISARLLGPVGRGEIVAIGVWPGLLAAAALLGLPEALGYFSARMPRGVGTFIGSSVAIALLSSVGFVAAGYAAMPLLLSAQPERIIQVARWYLLVIPVGVLIWMPRHALWGRGEFGTWNALRLMPPLCWLLLLIVAWYRHHTDVPTLFLAYLVVQSVILVPVSAYVVIRRAHSPLRMDLREGWRMVRWGVPVWLGSLPQLFRSNLEQLFMAALLPGQVLGLYAVASGYGNIATPILNGVSLTVLPQVAGQRSPTHQARELSRSFRVGLLIASGIATVLVLLAPWGVPLIFGRVFIPSVPVAVVLVLATTIYGLNQILVNGIRGLGHPAAVIRAEVFGLVMMAVLMVVLLPRLQMMGAAVASLAGSVTAMGIMILQVRRITALPLSPFGPSVSKPLQQFEPEERPSTSGPLP